jgi:hypothetical protein
MMRPLSDIGNLAVLRVDDLFTKEHFVSGVLRELSVSLCKTNAEQRRQNETKDQPRLTKASARTQDCQNPGHAPCNAQSKLESCAEIAAKQALAQ